MAYEYNNSLGTHWVREDYLVYDDYHIHEVCVSGCTEYTVSFKYKGTEVFLQEFPGGSDADFVGLGKITWLNSGPYCHFSITKMGTIGAIAVRILSRIGI